jgi:hypothetical protein
VRGFLVGNGEETGEVVGVRGCVCGSDFFHGNPGWFGSVFWFISGSSPYRASPGKHLNMRCTPKLSDTSL